MLELLAPAGDIQCFDTAIACGADAVYLGLSNFNARMKADNFDKDTLKSAVEKAHFFGVKVYVTLNTILQNNEFNDMIDMVKMAIGAKVDAFIVQDLGVCKVLLDNFQGIVIHASTQMGIQNLYGAKIAEEMGVKRVVLSRETKLEDIKAIRQNTSLEIEYFVQGALCISFSGNCYMSAKEQNASGNRGLCKQMCRLPYQAKLGDKTYDGYLLSARDMCLASSLKDLVDAGVTSFKIEGRMRRAEYVGQAVKTYRKLLDGISQNCNANQNYGISQNHVTSKNNSAFQNGNLSQTACRLSKEDTEKLKIAFGRGEYLDKAYLLDGVPKIVEKRYSNHIGLEIGKVLSVKPFKKELFEVIVSSRRKLAKGDGLKFFDGIKEKASLGIGDVKEVGKNEYSFVTKTEVRKGWSVNLIASSEQEAEALSQKRVVGIEMQVVARVGEPLQIQAEYKCNNAHIVVKKIAEQPLDRARQAVMSADDIAKQCGKVGDSGFEVAKCDVDTNGVFVAKSVLNALRRDVLNELKAKIIQHNSPNEVVFTKNNGLNIKNATLNPKNGVATIQDNALNVQNIASNSNRKDIALKVVESENVFNVGFVRKDEMVVIRPSVYTADEVKNTADILDISLGRIALDLPIIANGNDLKVIEKLLADLPEIRTLVSENIYGLYFTRKGYSVIVGQGHNMANAYAMKAVHGFGVECVVPSLEYPNAMGESAIASVDKDIPLMMFAHCPYKTLFDNDCARCSYKDGMTLSRTGKKYGVRRIRLSQCYFSFYPIEK